MKRYQLNGFRVVSAIVLLASMFSGAMGQSPTADPMVTTAKLDEYMAGAVKQGFSGSVLVSRDGKVVYAKGFGHANRELEVPNTVQTKFRLGSITKQFTAAAIMLLQERGKLNVQDPICKYIESCPPGWAELTIHHLLSHTGGVPNYTSFPDYASKMMIPETSAGMIARFREKSLEFKPGEKWNYSNSGYFLLGYIIEKVSGESYESFLQKNVFDPIGLKNTGYDRFATVLKNRATGYSRGSNGVVNSPYLDMGQPYSAGSLYSTVEDLFLWNEAIFADKLLSAKSREAMTTAVKNGYGYGLGVSSQFNRQVVSHGGGINGFNTSLERFTAEKMTVVVLRNVDFGAPGPGKMANDLVGIALGEKIDGAGEKVVVRVDPKIYDAYVGQYELAPGVSIEIAKKDDKLMGQVTGQQQFELFPESETRFFLKVVDAQVTFQKDDKGAVNSLIIHQGGDHPAKRIK